MAVNEYLRRLYDRKPLRVCVVHKRKIKNQEQYNLFLDTISAARSLSQEVHAARTDNHGEYHFCTTREFINTDGKAVLAFLQEKLAGIPEVKIVPGPSLLQAPVGPPKSAQEPLKPSRPTLSRDDTVRLLQGGFSVQEVAKKAGMTEQQVRNLAKIENLPI